MRLAPRLVELCFQTAGLWEIGAQHHMGLPRSIDRVSVWRAPDGNGGPFFAIVTAGFGENSFDVEVVDASGNRYVSLSGYRMIELPDSVDAEPIEALEAVMA
ncbi:MAG: hypothetical protein C5B51_02485 [Terriglobia bacterium]|nr:MAG: hypothetical protein C5B51_02485 [Terriglobia bacterium]